MSDALEHALRLVCLDPCRDLDHRWSLDEFITVASGTPAALEFRAEHGFGAFHDRVARFYDERIPRANTTLVERTPRPLRGTTYASDEARPTPPRLKRVPVILGAPRMPKTGSHVYIGPEVNCIKDGWRLNHSRWAPPFTWPRPRRGVPLSPVDVADAVRRYEDYVRARPDLMAALPRLAGKILYCSCRVRFTCHGRVLIKLVADSS